MNRNEIDRHLGARGAEFPAVEVLEPESGRGRQCALEQQVGYVLPKACQLERRSSAGEGHVGASLEFTLTLRMKICRSDGALHRNDDCRESGDVLDRAEGGEFLTVERLVARLTVGGTELRLFNPSEWLRKAERTGQLGIVEILLGVAVDAAAIGIDAGRQKQPFADGEEFFLREESVILDALALLEDTDVGACTDDPQSADEISAHDSRYAEIASRAVDAN